MEDGKEPVYASKAKPWLKYYDEKYIHQSVPECSAFALICRNNERHLGDTALEYYCIYIISFCPEYSPSVFVFQVCMPLEYHERALTFEISHEICYGKFGRY